MTTRYCVFVHQMQRFALCRPVSTPLASRLRPPLRGGLRPGEPSVATRSQAGGSHTLSAGAVEDETCHGVAKRSRAERPFNLRTTPRRAFSLEIVCRIWLEKVPFAVSL